LRLAVSTEGHPDNVAAALSGGLVLSTSAGGAPLVRRLEVPALQVAVTTPDFELGTRAARAALPRQVPLEDAVFNLSRTAFVVEALRSGDLDLLGRVMADRLHQPYRFKLIPGAEAAARAAREAGAVAVALSGAGPSLIAFAPRDQGAVAEAMAAAFHSAGLEASAKVLRISAQGATAGRVS
jgi:homoserine kinase